MPDDNGDAEDIEETGSWVCPNLCGAGGRCVEGDEELAVKVHLPSCPDA
jgi:hypothetical protein